MTNSNALAFQILTIVTFTLCFVSQGESSSISLHREKSVELKVKYEKAGFEFIGAVEGKVFLRPFEVGNTNWTTALGHCFNAGYRLAQVTSDAQHNLLESFAGEGAVWFWIDGTDSVEEGIWRSIYSGEKLTYIHWGGPEDPTGGTRENCLYWMKNPFYIGMKDGSCQTEVNHVLCETTL